MRRIVALATASVLCLAACEKSYAGPDRAMPSHPSDSPAAVGPYLAPVVNLESLSDVPNVNMITCAGQATTPIVAAVSSVVPVQYAEIVASIASKSAGPGTRANVDEFIGGAVEDGARA